LPIRACHAVPRRNRPHSAGTFHAWTSLPYPTATLHTISDSPGHACRAVASLPERAGTIPTCRAVPDATYRIRAWT